MKAELLPYWSVVRKILKSSKGVMDLQSVMIGVIVSAVLAATAFVAVVSMVRMTAIDTGKTNLAIIASGLESYYAENDYYPAALQDLADGEYIPKTLASSTDICYAAQGGGKKYPQSYAAWGYISSTKDIFAVSTNKRMPTLTTSARPNNCSF
jgi:Tfp pilus assembly protein PilE